MNDEGKVAETTLPYDDSDEESILRYASRLTGKTLKEVIGGGEVVIGGAHSKGSFGQILENEYFGIPNNNSSEPDFKKVGLELKVAPMVRRRGQLVSKERLVLGILDYEEAYEKNFEVFLRKGAHILVVFYLWEEDTDVYSYRVLKVVDWKPDDKEIRLIREDWDTIYDYIERGRAEDLSERHTKYLAACTKGMGHGRDLRRQPNSKVLAKQRALSLKASFMSELYYSHNDVGEFPLRTPGRRASRETIFRGVWPKNQMFEDYVLSLFDGFIGKKCLEIENMLISDNILESNLNSKSKQYFRLLTTAMLGIVGKRRIKEFDEANIVLKTVRVSSDGKPAESMSFPAFKYEELVKQTWEICDFHSQIDRTFIIPVFQHSVKRICEMKKEDFRDLEFRGVFFWYVPDDDFLTIRDVWEDTKKKILAEDFEHFAKESENHIVHIRPHARNSNDTYTFRGKKYTKRCFWFNRSYIQSVINENLSLKGEEENSQ